MKKGKLKLLLCLSLVSAMMFTGCSAAADKLSQSDNVADQALSQMMAPDSETDGDVKADTVIDISTELPADCKLTQDEMKAAIEEYVRLTNAELKEGSISVVFEKPNPETEVMATTLREVRVIITIDGVPLNKISNDPNAKEAELPSKTIRFQTIQECFGYLYNRNQITLLGERTPFAKSQEVYHVEQPEIEVEEPVEPDEPVEVE